MDKIQQIEKLLTYILVYSYLLFPAILLVAFLSGKKGKGREIFTIVFYGVLFFVLLKAFNFIPYKYRRLYNTGFTFLEYSFFASILFSFITSRKMRIAIITLSVLFVTFQVFFYFLSASIRLDSLPIGIETILLTGFIIYFFYDQSKNQRSIFIYYHPGFWVSTGAMIYLGGSFFFNILIDHLSEQEIKDFEMFTFIGDILKNICLSIALIILIQKPKEKESYQHTVPYLDY